MRGLKELLDMMKQEKPCTCNLSGYGMCEECGGSLINVGHETLCRDCGLVADKIFQVEQVYKDNESDFHKYMREVYAERKYNRNKRRKAGNKSVYIFKEVHEDLKELAEEINISMQDLASIIIKAGLKIWIK